MELLMSFLTLTGTLILVVLASTIAILVGYLFVWLISLFIG